MNFLNCDEYSKLMINAKNGCNSSFEKIINDFSKKLLNFFFRLSMDLSLSEDLVQEVFFRVWNNRNNYTVKAKFSTYIYKIANNLWKDEIKRRIRKPVNYNNNIYELNIKNDKYSVEDELESKALFENINKAVSNLDEKHRILFLLSEYVGLSYEEISFVLGIPIGTVRSRKSNAFRKIRDFFQLEDKYEMQGIRK